MPVGIVQFYLKDKGYGYIREEDTREEFHFVKKQLQDEVKDKDWVQFEIGEGKHGLFAKEIRLLEEEE